MINDEESLIGNKTDTTTIPYVLKKRALAGLSVGNIISYTVNYVKLTTSPMREAIVMDEEED